MNCSVQKRAFTLIELLVVVSIIALLISILLPSLSKAREQAKSAVCQSNLKQIGIGMMSYMAENNDVYPAAWDPTDGDPATNNWLATVAPYLGSGEARIDTFVDGGEMSRVWMCPSDKQEGVRFCYAMNYHVSFAGGVYPNHPRTTRRRLTDIPNPVTTIMVVDFLAGFPEFSDGSINHIVNPDSGLRHNGKANCLMAGLNVDWDTRDDSDPDHPWLLRYPNVWAAE